MFFGPLLKYILKYLLQIKYVFYILKKVLATKLDTPCFYTSYA